MLEEEKQLNGVSDEILSADECIVEGLKCHNDKKELRREMYSIAKSCSEQTGIDVKAILSAKDYLHYKGNGWGEDCIEKSKDKTKYPDRISPVFRKLFEIINNCYSTGIEEELKCYFDAIKLRGITITVDETMFNTPDTTNTDMVKGSLNEMDNVQSVICEKNDYMNDVLAEDAEHANLSPKNKYKQIIQLAAKKQDGKDIDDKVQDEYLKMELFTNGLEKITEL